MAAKVGLYACYDYDAAKIQHLLEEAFAENPEWLKGIGSGTKVFLKINLLMKKKPEEAVTTHPTLVEAMVNILKDRGAVVTIGDSPGGPYFVSRLKSIYAVCGIEDVAARTGAELNYDVTERTVTYKEGKVSKAFHLITPVVTADKVISISKLKTHQMTKFTGAVKNMFGAIPGLRKADYHIKMTKTPVFCQMLVDLALCVNPALHIMDGIIGMEGHGPSAGMARKVGAILVSDDPFALDFAAVTLAGIDAKTVPTIAAADSRGLNTDISKVEIVGSRLSDWHVQPFLAPRIGGTTRFPIPEFITASMQPKPVFDRAICAGCGDCVKNCPPRALKIREGYPEVNLNNCIRCFCCQELCPHKAVKVQRNFLGRLLDK